MAFLTAQRALSLLGIALLLAGASGFARADGMIMPIRPEVEFPVILNHYVTTMINDTYALTSVEQEFENQGYSDMEGTYVFPVPDGGVRNFNLVVDGKVIEGRLMGSDEARTLYQQYAIQRKEASLLEYTGKDAFSASVVLKAHQKVKVKIVYEQILDNAGGMYAYFYPLSTERYSTKPIDPVNVTIKINAPGKLGFIYSPTHNVSVSRTTNSSATVSYFEESVLPFTDFQLYWGVSSRDYDVKLLANRNPNAAENGTFMLFLYPSLNRTQIVSVPKDIAFIIDTSGSMDGEKIDQAKRALNYGLSKLKPEDRFTIIAFSDRTNSYSSALLAANESNIASAQAWVGALTAEGATDLLRSQQDAVTALAYTNESRIALAVLLTDGQDTTGHSDDLILAAMARARGNWKLFTFGVGSDVDYELLDKEANEFGDGIPVYVQNDADLETVLTSFYDRISTPLLTGVSLSVTGGNATIVDVYPRRVPDVFFGTQIVVVGRYSGSGAAAVTLSGKSGGQNITQQYEVVFPQSSANYFVERTWALRKVGYLLDQIALEGETPARVEEIKALATKYGIPTPYTSYVVTVNDEHGIQYSQSRDLDIGAMLPMVGAASNYKAAESGAAAGTSGESGGVKNVDDKTFVDVGGVWKDTACAADNASVNVGFGSQEYAELLLNAQNARYLSVGENVMLCSDGNYLVTAGAAGNAAPGVGIVGPGVPPGPNPSPTPGSGWLADIAGNPVIVLIPAGLGALVLAGFIIFSLSRSRMVEVTDTETHKALSSDTRIDLLSELGRGDRTPTDLSLRVGKSKATVAEHLDKLVEADLVEKKEEDGKKFVFYSLTRKGKDALRRGTAG